MNVSYQQALKVGWSCAHANGVLPVHIQGVIPGELPLPMLISNCTVVMSEVDAAFASISAVAESSSSCSGLPGGRDASVSIREWLYRWYEGMALVKPASLRFFPDVSCINSSLPTLADMQSDKGV